MEISERRYIFEVVSGENDGFSEKERKHLLYEKHRDNLVIRESVRSTPFCRKFGKKGGKIVVRYQRKINIFLVLMEVEFDVWDIVCVNGDYVALDKQCKGKDKGQGR